MNELTGTGPVGDVGATGATGPQGPTGPSGPPGSGGVSTLIEGSYVQFEAANFPNAYIYNNSTYLDTGYWNPSDQETFIVRPGQQDDGSVRFESLSQPGYYFAIDGSKRGRVLQQTSGILSGSNLSVTVTDGNAVLRVTGVSDRIRHSNSQIWAATDDGTALLAADSTWRVHLISYPISMST